MPKTAFPREDAFVRLRSAFRNEGRLHAGLVRPVFSRGERVRPNKDFLFHLHQHHEFEIIFIIRGPYYYRHNNASFQLPKNTVLILEPGDWHQDLCRPPLDYAAVLCTLCSRGDGKPIPSLRFFRKETPLSQRYTTFKASIFLPLLEKITQETQVNDAFTSNLQDTLMEELFWRLARSFDSKLLSSWLVPSQSKEQFLARLSTAMARHAYQSISIPSLARTLGLSQRSLSLHCTTLLGDSPARLFLRFKVEKARKLLAETETSVKEVSHRFGFANPYHFSRAYKSITGFSPSRTPTDPQSDETGAIQDWLKAPKKVPSRTRLLP
jgi:AraC-like DNA-binding protein